MSEPNRIVELNRQAVCASVDIVNRVNVSDLVRPTPCEGWTLADLLAHMTAQHRGFAAAARGNVNDAAVWDVGVLGDDPVRAYSDAAGDVLAAFADIDVGEQRFWLPEIRDGGPFPATMAVSFHLVDYVVHGWDVAVTIAAAPSYSDGVLREAVAIAQLVPDGEDREQPGAAFAHALPVGAETTPLDQILLLLGRRPAWTPPDT